jgi:hypothetical protein
LPTTSVMMRSSRTGPTTLPMQRDYPRSPLHSLRCKPGVALGVAGLIEVGNQPGERAHGTKVGESVGVAHRPEDAGCQGGADAGAERMIPPGSASAYRRPDDAIDFDDLADVIASEIRMVRRAEKLDQTVDAVKAGGAPLDQLGTSPHGPLERISRAEGVDLGQHLRVQQRQACQHSRVEPVVLGVLGVVVAQVRLLRRHHHDLCASAVQPRRQRNPSITGRFHHHGHLGSGGTVAHWNRATLSDATGAYLWSGRAFRGAPAGDIDTHANRGPQHNLGLEFPKRGAHAVSRIPMRTLKAEGSRSRHAPVKVPAEPEGPVSIRTTCEGPVCTERPGSTHARRLGLAMSQKFLYSEGPTVYGCLRGLRSKAGH